nr:DUF4286 family protein [uncultured Capnocytophaga sp.]
MYVYNLTTVVSAEVFGQWEDWLRGVYLPAIEASLTAGNLRIFRIMNMPDDKHFALHHEVPTPQAMWELSQKVVPSLLVQAAELFGEKVLFFGTELKLQEESLLGNLKN